MRTRKKDGKKRDEKRNTADSALTFEEHFRYTFGSSSSSSSRSRERNGGEEVKKKEKKN